LALHRILPPIQSLPLYSTSAMRALEAQAAQSLPPHTLMQRAGLSIARLACAIAPHARTIWLACGPGNNGGDGLEAAMHLQLWGREPMVTWWGDQARCPPDARASLQRAREAGVRFAPQPHDWDLAIDALLGIGANKRPDAAMQAALLAMAQHASPMLCVDLPSGLQADTGCWWHADVGKAFATKSIANYIDYVPGSSLKSLENASSSTLLSHSSSPPITTLSLLGLKPGLFTAQGRDACGELWWDDLDIYHDDSLATAWLSGSAHAQLSIQGSQRLHASHKGSYGDVAVIGGAAGMQGAALLAARTALHAGAGRVFVGLLDASSMQVDPQQPELMLRAVDSLNLKTMTVICGCGGGDAVHALLPRVLSQAPRLVLDADALNQIAQDSSLQTLLRQRTGRCATLLTPHPLEAARLLGISTAQVQQDRLQAAQRIAEQWGCTVILKGSGSIIASPGRRPCINPTGNAALATAGTGDVLAGLCGAYLAQYLQASEPVAQARQLHGLAQAACWQHGHVADEWKAQHPGKVLVASELARKLSVS
jgi:ADP-dependent NAD(P)H-hydrate dehydratase / NAD(P)H-hydrate epimerase